jgi:group I intron endonuclease
MTIGVYRITSPSKRVYIGSSIDIERRFNDYRNMQVKYQVKLRNSFLKYGVDAHKFKVLIECDKDELYKWERLYGEHYDSLGRNGLNGVLPKYNDIKGVVSEETRKRMSQALKGIVRSQDYKNKMRMSLLGREIKPETKVKLSIAAKNRKRQKHSDYTKSIMNVKSEKLVLDFGTGIFFDSCKKASIAYGVKFSTLRCKLNGNNRNKTLLKYV